MFSKLEMGTRIEETAHGLRGFGNKRMTVAVLKTLSAKFEFKV